MLIGFIGGLLAILNQQGIKVTFQNTTSKNQIRMFDIINIKTSQNCVYYPKN